MQSAKGYLTKSELTLELAKMAAVFPNFKATDLTWEVYWEDLHFIPKEKLVKGIEHCRKTGTFFASVAELIKASIGADYGAAKWNPYRPATIHDIIRAYQEEHRIEMILLGDEKQKLGGSKKALPDPEAG